MKTSAILLPALQKSTNVRAYKKVDFQRVALLALSSIAPGVAGRVASRMFLTPPRPRPLSAKARDLFARADDSFPVRLKTSFGGTHESSQVMVSLWGRGPAVYMLHGWGGRGSQWISFVDPLVRAGFTAVVLDAPAHGESIAPRTSILHFAASLAAVVNSVGPAQGVIGHSLGAAAASLAMRQGLAADRAVLIGSPADPGDFFREFLGRLGILERVHASIQSDVERRYDFRWNDLAVAPPPAERNETSVPALIVQDADDAEVAPADADRIADAWPGARILTTRGLGHQRILRDESVVSDIVAWLSQPPR